MYSYFYVYVLLLLCVIIGMFMYPYCYLRSVLFILFHRVVMCTVCVQMCIVVLPLGVNPIAINK